MFQIEECIENVDKALSNTNNTTVILSKGGDNFFMAHIENKKRYQKLVDIYTPFIHRTVTKVRQEGLNDTAYRLDQNKHRIKQYLKNNKWLWSDMATHQWQRVQNDTTHVYGQITDNDLRNCKGICINYYGNVYIGYHDQYGRPTKPYIFCSEARFKINE